MSMPRKSFEAYDEELPRRVPYHHSKTDTGLSKRRRVRAPSQPLEILYAFSNPTARTADRVSLTAAASVVSKSAAAAFAAVTYQ